MGGIREATVVDYDASGPGYVLRPRLQQRAAAGLVQVPAAAVRPTFAEAAVPEEALARFAERHAAEAIRREVALEANALAAAVDWTDDAIQVGTAVELREGAEGVVDLPQETRPFLTRRGVVRMIERPARAPRRYVVQFEAASGATSLSSDSHIAVSAEGLVPVFWRSRAPLDDARALIGNASAALAAAAALGALA